VQTGVNVTVNQVLANVLLDTQVLHANVQCALMTAMDTVYAKHKNNLQTITHTMLMIMELVVNLLPQTQVKTVLIVLVHQTQVLFMIMLGTVQEV